MTICFDGQHASLRNHFKEIGDILSGMGLKGFRIAHGNFILNILLLRISELKFHEEIIGALKDDILHDILRRNLLLDPIIVEERNKVILDGAHRVAALKEIGANFVPSCLINYDSSEVKVKRWFRGIKLAERPQNINLKEISSKFIQKDLDTALNEVNKGRSSLALLGKDFSYVLQKKFRDSIECSWFLKKVENYFRENGARIYYLTNERAINSLLSGNIDLILTYKPIKKEEVILAGISGRFFAYKSTRHVVPRPLRVNVPIDLLSMSSLKRANEAFIKLLSSRKLVGLGENVIIDGRIYEEYVYMFSDRDERKGVI